MIEEASSVVPGWRERAVVVNPGCDVDLFEPADARRPGEPVVGFVGKLIAAKGVHHLLGALGLTAPAGLRAVIVGYGGLEQRLRALAEALTRGDLNRAHALSLIGETGRPLTELLRFLSSERAGVGYRARLTQVPVEFLGRLDHGPLARVLPSFDALVAPSIVPEAFGMVAAEAAACGVPPIVPRHSGIGELGAAVEAELGAPGLLTYDPDDPIAGIAAAIDRVLGVPPARKLEVNEAVASLARRRWSWRGVAERLLELACPSP